MPPSLLFTGPDGVGKRLVAQAVAQALDCLSPALDPFDACGKCGSCRKIARGTHPDILVVEPGDTGSIKIDQVRQVIEQTAYRPFEGRWRIVIVDDADRMNADSQNALLKNLEEPPAGSIFILVTARPETLLPTVLSRCSRLRFGRLPAADVARLLIERHGQDAEEAHAAAAVSDGSPGRALESASRAFRGARSAALDALRAAAGSQGRPTLEPAQCLLGKGKSGSDREELAARLRVIASLLRDVALVANDGREEELANGDLRGEIADLARAFDQDRAMRGFAAADRAIGWLRRNAGPKIVADWVAVHL